MKDGEAGSSLTDYPQYTCSVLSQYVGPNGPEYFEDGSPVMISTPWPPREMSARDKKIVEEYRQKHQIEQDVGRYIPKHDDIARVLNDAAQVVNVRAAGAPPPPLPPRDLFPERNYLAEILAQNNAQRDGVHLLNYRGNAFGGDGNFQWNLPNVAALLRPAPVLNLRPFRPIMSPPPESSTIEDRLDEVFRGLRVAHHLQLDIDMGALLVPIQVELIAYPNNQASLEEPPVNPDKQDQ